MGAKILTHPSLSPLHQNLLEHQECKESSFWESAWLNGMLPKLIFELSKRRKSRSLKLWRINFLGVPN
jgi:hypothetical protein